MTAHDIARLSPKQRLDLIGELWDSLSPEDVRLTPAQDAELARRLEHFEADRQSAVSLDVIEADWDKRRR